MQVAEKAPDAAPPTKAPAPPSRRSKRVRPATVTKIQLGLLPRKAVYDLGARPKLVPRIFGVNGVAIHPNRLDLTYRVEPKGVATVRAGRLRFLKEGRGKVSACYGKICGRTVFMGVERTGLP